MLRKVTQDAHLAAIHNCGLRMQAALMLLECQVNTCVLIAKSAGAETAVTVVKASPDALSQVQWPVQVHVTSICSCKEGSRRETSGFVPMWFLICDCFFN
jgi:hypothetical protein